MIDELAIYRGNNYYLNQKIVLRQPTVGEICDYGEEHFWKTFHTLTATTADLKVFIYDNLHKWWDEISNFEVFTGMYKSFTRDDTSIILGDLDLSKFEVALDNKDNTVVLYNSDTDTVIDEIIYEVIMEYIRKLCGFTKNTEVGTNKTTKRVMIDVDRDDMYFNQKNAKPFQSILLPMISSMINSAGFKYNHQEVWDMPIFAFMDSVKRIQTITQYNNNMRGVYSGCLDSKKLNKKDLDWMHSFDS